MTLHDLLGHAYGIAQIKGDRNAAVAYLVAGLTDPELRQEAMSERDRLAAVVAAREQGGVHGCHFSNVCLGLLKEIYDTASK